MIKVQGKGHVRYIFWVYIVYQLFGFQPRRNTDLFLRYESNVFIYYLKFGFLDLLKLKFGDANEFKVMIFDLFA